MYKDGNVLGDIISIYLTIDRPLVVLRKLILQGVGIN